MTAAALAFAAALAAFAAAVPARVQASDPGYAIVGDTIPAPLEGRVGDAARGRAIVADRQAGMCLLCHAGPFPEERFPGDLGPSLAGVGVRYSVPQLRLRVVSSRTLNPASIMPSTRRVDGLERVAPAWRGRPILTAQQVEDVVALLATLKD